MGWLKAHWVWIVGAVIAFIAYRSLASQIADVAGNQSASGTGTMMNAAPLYYANAGGYDGVSGSTATVGGSSDALSQSLLSAMQTIQAGQQANDALAITGANVNSASSIALNSSVSNQLGTAYQNVLSTFLANPGSNLQTLNLSANPTSSGGISLTASKDINLNAIPTTAQSANYASNSVFGSGTTGSLFSTLTTPAPTTTPTVSDFSYANFNAGAYAAAHPGYKDSQSILSGSYSSLSTKNLYKIWQSTGNQSQFTALKTAA